MNNFKIFYSISLIIFISLFSINNTDAQIQSVTKLAWNPPLAVQHGSVLIYKLNFDKADYLSSESMLPVYHKIFEVNKGADYQVSIEDEKYVPLSYTESKQVVMPENIPSKIVPEAMLMLDRKKPVIRVSFIPVRSNSTSGIVEKLLSCTIRLTEKPAVNNKEKLKNRELTYKEHSILRNGKWTKLKVSREGLYRLTASEISSMGISDGPQNVRVFGNKGGMLSLTCDTTLSDDLEELSIFRGADYILFYAPGPVRWRYDSIADEYKHTVYNFSDYEYYFVTGDAGTGKTISQDIIPAGAANISFSTFNDYGYHEIQDTNLIKSGSKWYGEGFGIFNSYDFNFAFPYLVSSVPVKLTVSVVARSNEASSFTVNYNNNEILDISNISPVDLGETEYTYAVSKTQSGSFTATGDDISINVVYNLPNTLSHGWLDYIDINAERQLKMTPSFLRFRNKSSVGKGNISDFSISGANSNCEVWDVSDILNVKKIPASFNQSTYELSFKVNTDLLREFAVLDFSSFLTPETVGEVSNQDLHGMTQPELIIVSHPDFLSYAEELADIHREKDQMNVIVATSEQVYNEFSAGNPDIGAIRNMVRMYYDRAGSLSDQPKYLLLFGDGSYDNKSGSSANTNYVLTFQSGNSLNPIGTFCSDDFFGLLDMGEGPSNGLLDIGVGRLPVKTAQEAEVVLSKIKNYINPSTMGDWRNIVSFIADDSDNSSTNAHIAQADQISSYVNLNNPVYNIDKIYLDAFRQTSGASGQRYPDVNAAIENRVNRGALIINYTGHGNEVGLAHEQVITISDITNWENYDRLFFFVTATCEFSRFDDYWRTSGGELALLNPGGGAIALLSTTRPVYPSSLNNNFYSTVFGTDFNNEPYRMGDVVRITKNITDAGSGENTRKFILLGDPALRLAYPINKAVTTEINSVDITLTTDTIKALDKVTVKGLITDEPGNKLVDFNGYIFPTVFDKPKILQTMCNEGNPPVNFSVQNNIIYKGKASVSNGEFSFSFIVPKDISYDYGFGKISYYATSETTDANGYTNSFVIGGSSELSNIDNSGPDISLYMNDDNFKSGGITDENPKLLAYVFDTNGVNTVGNGIGHDITAIIDGNTNNTMVLNDYYESDLDSYKSGKIEYKLYGLTPGNHSIRLKVWDVFNNSSEKDIDFFVTTSNSLVINRLYNYPNPFKDFTEFHFEQNQADVDLDVQLQIFSITGRLLKTIDYHVASAGFNPDPYYWDGRDDYGNKISNGIYIYGLTVNASNGKSSQKYEKLLIIN